MIKKVRPGDEVAAWCGRCKDERTHQVIALNSDGVPATVVCRTCGEQHRYRTLRTIEEAAARKSTGASVRRGTRSAAAASATPDRPPRPYSPRESFAEGDWVEHVKFGAGRVIQAREGKIEVKFSDVTRLLVHAG